MPTPSPQGTYTCDVTYSCDMPNMTLAIPEDIHRIMKRYPEISWSHVAREAIAAYAKRLELLDELTKDSKLTEEDTIELGRKVKQGMWRRIQQQRKDDEARR